ncbi:MAG: FtsX-like permease family protein [Myxococcales bacterium]|nr:FtsX-like permease family protein [Myxococcales bacterium]
MKSSRLLGLVAVHLRASRVAASFAIVGVAVGVAFLCFFIGLGEGLRARVLNRIFPAEQIEIEPRAVRIFGVEGTLGQPKLDAARVAQVGRLPGVVAALGKQKSAFPAKLWGGKQLLGYDLHTEAFFDGMPATLLRPELEQTEGVAAKRIARKGRALERCDVHEDCPAGSFCRDGGCDPVEWAPRFDAAALHLRCTNDAGCVSGQTCLRGRCAATCGAAQGESQHCSGVCAQASCRTKADCPQGSACGTDGRCEIGACLTGCQLSDTGDDGCPAHQRCVTHAGAAVCEPIRCELGHASHQRSLDPSKARGFVTKPCADGQCRTTQPCPSRLYCAADHPDTASGTCEWPLPTVVNPLLLEVFNSDMAASLNLARVASPEVLFGVRYHIAIGDSHFTRDAARSRQQVKQAVVVGFSPKAPELGVALPLALVRHHNARIKGPEAAESFGAILVSVRSNEHVASVIKAVEDMGFVLSRRSRVARTFGTVVFLIYLALVLLSLIVLMVAAANITHTLAMLVHERRRELAVLRALGATAMDVALLVVLEGAFLGVIGGLVGVALAWGGAAVVERLAADALRGVPLVPTHFFEFPGWLLPTALAVAISFCVVGSIIPARRATRLDPATVLSQP